MGLSRHLLPGPGSLGYSSCTACLLGWAHRLHAWALAVDSGAWACVCSEGGDFHVGPRGHCPEQPWAAWETGICLGEVLGQQLKFWPRLATCQVDDLLARPVNGISPSRPQCGGGTITKWGKLRSPEVMSPAYSTLGRERGLEPCKALGCRRAATYLQGCRPREGLQGLQGLLGLSSAGLWLLGDRLQRKRPGR